MAATRSQGDVLRGYLFASLPYSRRSWLDNFSRGPATPFSCRQALGMSFPRANEQCIKLYNYPCGVFACPLLHQHASTPLAWSTCYCTKCRALMYPCMPCWSFYNRPASPVYDMPASYQLPCTHCHDTHWRRLSVVVAPEQGSPPKAGFPASYINCVHHWVLSPASSLL